MIQCTLCNIAFSPSFTTCPRCKSFPTPLTERKRYLTQDAKNRISDGQSVLEVRQRLLENGFSDSEADVLLGDAASSVRRETRGYGMRRFFLGMTMLGLAGLLMLVVGSGATLRGASFSIGFLILAGGGSLAAISGLYTMIFGRESKLVGKIVDNSERLIP